MRVAAIDIGTNSIHLVVADVGPDGSIQVVEKGREQVELGRGGLASNKIASDAMDRAATALEGFARTAELLQVEAITAAATSAVREAKNGAEFCDRITQATGIHIRVISGIDEARLIWRGARPILDAARCPALLVDIGGGSVELVIAAPDRVMAAYSLPLGHLRTSEQFLSSDPPSSDEIGAIRKRVRALLKPILADVRTGEIQSVIGTSGSIRTLGRMATLMRGDPVSVHDHGLVLQRSELKKLLVQFQELKSARLSELPGMDSRRRTTLPAAAAVLYQIMRSLELEQLSTSESALREGLLYEWIEHHRPELALAATEHSPRTRSVLALMDRYGVDRPHAERVRDLSLALYDGLAPLHGLGPDSRATLEWAALVHDVGHHIDARNHNRHGEYLILHTPMHGFTAPELAVLATVVRHHRGARPKNAHKGYRSLSRANQRRVQVLAAVLRVADALDRSHNQPIRSLSVLLPPPVGGTREVIVRVEASAEAYLERWAAERRSELLAQVLDANVRIDVVTDGLPADFPSALSDQVE